ncbi:hypothetical protein JHK82_051953 [Glycine max]|nr:hypothetical protein JHK82_051953 [Glycine max]
MPLCFCNSSKGFMNIDLQTDSEAVVKGINGNSEGSSMGLKLIQEICRLQNLGGSIRNVCT